MLWQHLYDKGFAYLSTRALLGKICSSDEVPFTKKERTGGEALFESMEIILAGNDIVISPVTRTIQLQKKMERNKLTALIIM